MSKKMTESQIRMKIALLLEQENIDIEDLYGALGVNLQDSKIEAVSHFAGIIDGLSLAKEEKSSLLTAKKDNSSK